MRRFFLGLTPFDVPLLVFVVTAGIGVWAAYDRQTAWAKFGVIVAAVALYYILALQPGNNLWYLVAACELIGVGVAGYFMLTYDWQKWPADFGWLTRLGVGWMALRPTLPGFIHPNVAGGLLVMLAPFAVALEVGAWRQRRKGLLFINTLGVGLILLGLLFTSSRGAWAALAVALGVWGAWYLIDRLARWQRWPGWVLFAALSAIVAVGLAVLISAYPGGPVALVNRMPGAQDGFNRYEMVQGALRLVEDFPFTGGGLNAFSGLYSTYILVIRVPLFTYSHNVFLDVAVEQGWFGLLALAAILIGSAGLVVFGPRRGNTDGQVDLLRWAVLSSLIAICLHGLLDDALYGNGGTPLVFLTPGMAVMVARAGNRLSELVERLWGLSRWSLWVLGLAGVAVLAVLVTFRQPVLSTWYANLGAVRLAQKDLAGWPDNRAALLPSDLDAAGKLFGLM